MDIFSLLTLIGGLSLFLYGMTAMGNGLSKMAGGRLESILERLTSKRIFAVLLGAGVTAVIQSSSATTVMVVGFVNSGIMQLSQAVGIIMGANVGTTATSWLLSLTGIEGSSVLIQLLKPSSFSPILAAIGIILTMSSKEENKKKDIGNILLGFAILMFGMETMSSAVAPLAQNEAFTGVLTLFSNPFLGMLVGAILTAIIQSSSASIGILQALCATGAVNYGTALPIIMGQNIGTCVTSMISSIGANKNAKRAATIHLLFNLIGTIVFMVAFYALNAFVHFAFLDESASAVGIAVIHSVFNIGCCVLFYPFADKLVQLVQIIIPDGPEADDEVEQNAGDEDIAIDERFMESPAFAMELCRSLTQKMAMESKKALEISLDILRGYDSKKAEKVYRLEERTDKYEDVLGTYLVKLSSKNLSKNDSQSMSIMLHSISDWERIGDHAVNIVESIKEMRARELSFSKKATKEMEVASQAIEDILEKTWKVFSGDDAMEAIHIEPLEEVIDSLMKEIKQHHIKRLRNGKCTIELGLILEDILTNLERVSDHCSNIAVEMMAISEDGYDTHEYFERITESEKESFYQEYEDLKQKYSISKKDDTINEEKQNRKNKSKE